MPPTVARRGRSHALAGTLATITVLFAVGCSRESAIPATASATPLPVRTALVRAVNESIPLVVPGTVRPAERAVIAPRISGTIEELPVVLGQTVARGDLLAKLAAPELGARAAQARVQLAQAEREAERTRDLAARGADTADAAKAANERLGLARAALAEAEAMLGFAEIRAPFAGRVARRPAYAGDLASPGKPLLELESTGPLVIEAAVPASLAANLTRHTTLSARIAGVLEPFACRVIEIAAAADSATRTVLVKLEIPAADPALSGRYAAVEIPSGEKTVQLLAPTHALTRFGQMERLFVAREGTAHLRLVKSGAIRGTDTEILAGVNAGETVVLDPPSALRDGQPVHVSP